MATSVLKVPEKGARKLLAALNVTGAAKASPKKLVKLLEEAKENMNGDSVEDLDVPSSAKSLMEEISDAIDEERTLKIVSAAVEEDEEEEETPKKKSAKKVKTKTQPKSKTAVKTKTKKKSSAKGVARKKTGGKTNKDMAFEAWLKNPAYSTRKLVDKLKDQLEVKEMTILHWISDFKNGGENVGYPRIAAGREKEIKAAIKASK